MPDPGVGTYALLPLTLLPIAGYAQLACLIHAANVRSEPGSNPSKLYYVPRGAGLATRAKSQFQTFEASALFASTQIVSRFYPTCQSERPLKNSDTSHPRKDITLPICQRSSEEETYRQNGCCHSSGRLISPRQPFGWATRGMIIASGGLSTGFATKWGKKSQSP